MAEWCVEIGLAEEHSQPRLCTGHKEQDLDAASNVVVHEATLKPVVHLVIDVAVHVAKEVTFEEVMSYQEENNHPYCDDEARVGGQDGYYLVGEESNVWFCPMMGGCVCVHDAMDEVSLRATN